MRHWPFRREDFVTTCHGSNAGVGAYLFSCHRRFRGMAIAHVAWGIWHSQQRHSQMRETGVVLLLGEDDTDMRSLLYDELSEMGLHIVEAANGDQMLRSIMDHAPSLILTDLRMPAGGMEYVSRLRKCAPDVPIILMTAFGDPKTKAEALGLGVAAYFDKPVRISDLKLKVEELLKAA